VMARIKAASTMAGLDRDVPQRKLFLLRNGAWPTGPRTQETVQEFHAQGGRTVPVDPGDLKVFEALRVIQSEHHDHLPEWLAARTPASNTSLFQTVLGDGLVTAPESTMATESIADAPPVEAARDAHPYAVRLGV